jgi:hypothetical protein
MAKVGILAFGSVMDHPGEEIEAAVEPGTEIRINTEFKIEFARTSSTRENAPTLAVVEEGGDSVLGKLFVLKKEFTLEMAKNILLRREKDKVGDASVVYSKPEKWMEIKEHSPGHGCEKIIYASMTQNIPNPTAKKLAELAIASAKKHPMKHNARADGIQYLNDVKKMGIRTPLMQDYENEILVQLGVDSLQKALDKTKN